MEVTNRNHEQAIGPAKFKHFTRLPPELRHMVWTYFWVDLTTGLSLTHVTYIDESSPRYIAHDARDHSVIEIDELVALTRQGPKTRQQLPVYPFPQNNPFDFPPAPATRASTPAVPKSIWVDWTGDHLYFHLQDLPSDLAKDWNRWLRHIFPSRRGDGSLLACVKPAPAEDGVLYRCYYQRYERTRTVEALPTQAENATKALEEAFGGVLDVSYHTPPATNYLTIHLQS
ncbi:Uu.00g091990.m01.CDS01 [Anthostomella pinea]|uniref:Uu.00g091990.m01.CDS01 n=1 Tax=Anthostomella pinea TaxID=933095 RepID=A0AAI8YKJ7_9PEZI|nr:Uu.00g091990.m01.CDS01 [Anthostomella pinea]